MFYICLHKYIYNSNTDTSLKKNNNNEQRRKIKGTKINDGQN